MNDIPEQNIVDQTGNSPGQPDVEPALCVQLLERFDYLTMTEAEQDKTFQEIVDEVGAKIAKMKDDEQQLRIEKCRRIGCLLIQARQDACLARANCHHGKKILALIAEQCGICERTLFFYNKLAQTFHEQQVARFDRADLRWFDVREVLNLVGHGSGMADRVAEVERHLPDNDSKESRANFRSWLKARHSERNTKPPKETQPDDTAQPDGSGSQMPVN